MSRFDFDKIIDRRNTGAVKIDGMKAEFGRADLVPAWIADMDFEVCPQVTEALTARFAGHHIYGYTTVPDSYWQAIVDWQRRRNGFEIATDEISFIPGVVTGVALAINFFTRPGDRVVIQEPVYHPFRRVITDNDRVVVNNALIRDDDGYCRMDFEGLEHIFATRRPVIMVVCNPHNPMGIVWSPDVLRQVASLARRYGVKLISDEIHSDLMLYGHKHHPLPSVSDDAAAVTIAFGAPTKTFNIAGLHSSWCVVKNPELRVPFYRWLSANELNLPNMTAVIAAEAAYTHGEEWLAEVLRYIEGNIDFVADFCRDHMPQVKALKPQASYLVWLDFTQLGLDHKGLQSLLIDHAHVAMNDGTMFGHGGEQHARLNVAAPRQVIADVMQRIADAVNARR